MIARNTDFKNFAANSLPPQNVDAEEAILGGILLDPEAYPRIQDLLPTDAFYLHSHQVIYEAIKSVNRKGLNVDLMTVTSELTDSRKLADIGGTSKLAQLLDKTVSAVNIDRYADIVLEKHKRRLTITLGQEMINAGYDTFEDLKKLWEGLQRKFEQLCSKEDPDQARFDALIKAIKRIETYIDDPGLRHLKKKELAKEYGIKSVSELDQIFLMHISNRERIPMMKFDELKEKYGADVQKWLISGIFPANSFNLIDALGGCGKTMLLYDFALHLLSGTPWNGLPVTNLKERRILIIQADESPGATVNALRDRISEGEENIQFLPGWDLNQLGHLEKEMEKFKPCFVLVDSLTAINRTSGVDENSAAYVARLKGLHLLCQNHGATCCVIHHSNKNGHYRGSTAIPAAFDQHFSLRRPQDAESKQDCRRVLSIEKSRYRSPESYELELEPETKTWKLLGKVSDKMDLNKSIRDRIVAMLSESRGVQFAAQEVREELGGNINTVRKELNILVSEGIIGRIKSKTGGSNVYFIPDDRLDEGIYSFSISDGGDPGDPGGDLKADHLPNPDSEKVSAGGDPMIRNFGEKSRSPKTSETGIIGSPHRQNLDGDKVTIGDPGGDPGDPQGDQQITSFSIGDTVIYTGNDRSKQSVCLERRLKVMSIKGDKAMVLYDKWVFEKEIPISDLELVENKT